MSRTFCDRIGTIKEFSNGNINIKFDPSGVYKNESDIINLLWLVDSCDIYDIGEQYCLSNYDLGLTLYNLHSDKCYILSFTELAEKFNNGKTLKLYAHTPDNYEREEINARFEQ